MLIRGNVSSKKTFVLEEDMNSPASNVWLGEGGHCPLPNNPFPLSAFGLEFRPFGPHECNPKTDSWLRRWLLSPSTLYPVYTMKLA